jgi:ATP-dependent Lhr-like helicase
MQDWRSRLPHPGELLVESFPHQGRAYSVFYTFEGGTRTSRWAC